MPKVSIKLPTELYRELQSAAASMQEPGYSAVNFITDVLTSDLASRRLPRMALAARRARHRDQRQR